MLRHSVQSGYYLKRSDEVFVLYFDRDIFIFSWFWLVSFLLVILYPRREVLDLSWVVIPMWAVGLYFVDRVKIDSEGQQSILLIYAVVLLVLLLFITMN